VIIMLEYRAGTRTQIVNDITWQRSRYFIFPILA
jgi:hypothetical protein